MESLCASFENLKLLLQLACKSLPAILTVGVALYSGYYLLLKRGNSSKCGFLIKLEDFFGPYGPAKLDSETVNPPPESSPDWQAKGFVKSHNIDEDGSIRCFDPATGKDLGAVKATSAKEVDAAVARAYAAQRVWAKTSFAERRQVLRTLCEYVLANQEQICQVACRDSGKTMVDAMLGEVLTTLAKLRWTIQHGERVLGVSERDPGLLMMYKRARVIYQPRGVVGAIVSWNYPFHNSIGPVISAIFAGNGIVVKTSEHVAWSHKYFERIVRAALEVHGHPGDLVQFVTGFAETGQALVGHPDIKHVTFIGSAGVGAQIMKHAAENLTPVTLELGGKDCAIIMNDVADFNAVCSVIMRGTFQNMGQNCIGIERVLVHERIYDKFVTEMSRRIQELRIGSSLESMGKKNGSGGVIDCGAMVLGGNFKRLEELIAQAVEQGARLVLGGKEYKHPDHPHGQYFTPTLLVDVTPEMDIAKRCEVFGPVMTVMKIKSADDAVEQVNSAHFGLGSSVFTGNKRVGQDILQRLNCGMGNLNDFAVNYLCQSLPFGGINESGFGRFGGEEGLREMCVTKSYTEDVLFGIVQTSIPPAVDYPIKDARKAFAFTEGINGVGFSSGVVGMIKSIFKFF